MGGAVSIGADLPERLTEDQVKAVCGENYNPHWFQGLQNERHTVALSDLTIVVNSKVEREVLHLYFTYCPTGRMKNSAFYAMCRESKLLTKMDFPIQKAEKIFETVVGEHEAMDVRTISYHTFRHHVIPMIAPLKSWKVDKVMLRLSQCEALIENKTELRKARYDMRVSSNVETVGVTSEDCLEGVGQKLDLGAMFGASQQNAVVKIQSISRQKNCKKEAGRRKEIERAESGEEPIVVKEEDKPDEGDESEVLVKTYYHKLVGPAGEMDKRQFVEFMREGMAIDHDLTTIDCQFIFRKAKATALSPGNTFKDCVVYRKRLLYPAVRILCLSQAALFKGLVTSKFIQGLAAGLVLPKEKLSTPPPAKKPESEKN
mmetsp:Transcript_6020/g.9814  ORF Transcript_6020/g.9814 Transcript_6020/m.9814 type:complete len:373 (+) Transcript_6020:169-1287(+)